MERLFLLTIAAFFSVSVTAGAEEYTDYNSKILETVDWLAKNRAGLGYDLKARYTESLQYGGYTFKSNGGTKTMCVAAVFEILIRALANTKAASGEPVSEKILPGKVMGGSKALNIAPYVFQYAANVEFPEYGQKYSAGIGDAFVLFGIGRYVTFDTAKPGDFVYLNRASGSGHATVFINYLDTTGKPTQASTDAVGFRYFSAQEGGTNGLGYRDAFFGVCPAVETTYKKDCKVIKSKNRRIFSVSRLHDPNNWFTSYSAIRVERFFKGDTIDKIYSDEPAFRTRARSEQEEAERKAKKYALSGLYPLIIPPIAGESKSAELSIKNFQFDDEEFGPNFEEL